MEYYRHSAEKRCGVNNENKGINNDTASEKLPRLTLPSRIAFLSVICLFTLLWTVGVLGIFSFVLAVLASALNILWALDARDSKGGLLILLVANLVPFAAALLYLQSVTSALNALYPLIMATAVCLTLRMRMGRAVSVIAAALPAAVLWFCTFAVTVYSQFGVLSADSVNSMLDLMLTEPMTAYVEALAEQLGEEGAVLLNAVNIETLVYYCKSLLIGSITAVMIVWAYLVTLAARIIAGVFGLDVLLPTGLRIGMLVKRTQDGPTVELFRETVRWRIELDSVSAGVYIAAYLVSMLFASDEGALMPAVVAENLLLMLSPGFFYCGARDVVLGFRGKASMGKMSVLILVPALLLAFINPSVIVILLCAMGVVVTFRENGARRRMINNGKEPK